MPVTAPNAFARSADRRAIPDPCPLQARRSRDTLRYRSTHRALSTGTPRTSPAVMTSCATFVMGHHRILQGRLAKKSRVLPRGLGRAPRAPADV